MRFPLARSCPALPALVLLAVFPLAAQLTAQPAAAPEVGGQVPLVADPPAPAPARAEPGRPRPGVLLATFPADPASAVADQVPPAAPPPTLTADAAWVALKTLGRPKLLPPPATDDAAGRAAAHDQVIAAYVADADQLHDFATKHPEHPQAREARRREALALLHASVAGDMAQEARRTALVAAVRADASLPAADRIQLAVLADNLAVARRRDLTDADRSRAYEPAARALLAEFPAAPEAAEALLQVARASDDARALATELLALASAPASVQHAAGVLAARQALAGRSLRPLAATAFGPEHPLARPTAQPLIVYSWHSASRSSLALAGRIAALAPKGALIFGVCLDSGDLAPARALAEAGAVPGGQVFHPLGRRGAFAAASQLVDPGLVYTAGPDGLILSVSAQRDLAAAFAPLNRPQGD